MIRAGIYRNKELVGILTKKDDATFIFQYEHNYLNSAHAKNISVNFPLQEEAFTSDTLFAFFFNMLSEGNVKKAQCRNLKIDENDSFTRLLKTAYDDVIGSVTVQELSLDNDKSSMGV